MGNTFSQHFPPTPQFTEANVPDLTGKIYIVTGSNTGVGREVAQILYSKHATVWIACRNEAKAEAAIDAISQQHPSSKGKLKFLSLNLSDLSTIASSAETFLSQESRLDVLFNNAGVMMPPPGSKTEQCHDLELGVNCLGPFLFTKLLTPILKKSAESAPKGSVRVVWVSSSAADAMSPSGGVVLDNLDYKVDKNVYHKYGVSKAGNYFHATQFARLYKPDGVISIPLNPGNLLTELDRSSSWWVVFGRWLVCYAPIYGAYTEIFAAFSSDIGIHNTGAWIVPWGRFASIREDVRLGSLTLAEGGTGTAERFWEWSEEQVKPYTTA
ncbi:short-chain dehydrogenase protein [Pochonia chlamydosporia 170]|uniref:Short-chain dehydrogenase protein n=1 Tax=Pochonia chlamydosporia 170 TaxID=1380566 RepID=A0A179F728_METCM|nr:short-chain dehydrogenase protein [Pochonia chlamydosporia 170]OAQ61207.1 short-chain dehydrogenase protein [Pochonia chlamydosporia 170]